MQKITPVIWAAGTADQQADLYTRAFGAGITGSQRYPEQVPDVQKDLAGKTLTIDLDIKGYTIGIINADDTYKPNPSVSFMMNFDPAAGGDARQELAAAHAALMAAGSTELMPLGSYDFSEFYAWVQDPYGVSWQLMLTNPAGEPRPAVLPAIMFIRGNHALAFTDKLMELFPGSTLGNRMLMPGTDDQVLFSDAKIAGSWFMISDGGSMHDFSFSGGVSLLVTAEDQAEIDRLWEAISAVPEAERCGWCLDEYGISWQVIPANFSELMAQPGAQEKFMSMGKIDIAALTA
ncbi:MAG: VOC family protein [Rothia sp. (in: high G+C Gram-positive bacteria)]|nr:VOC family protein [Rothia sp. (in: high G+C Gram-positive bacteria)]